MLSAQQRCCCAFLAALGVLAGPGCFEPFGGSNIQISFSSSTQVPGPADINDRADDGRPPSDTHYSFIAVRNAEDGGGAFAFEVAQFDVAPLLTPSSPCFIELSGFEGLHSTQVVNKLRAELGVPEGAEYDPGTPVRDASRIITATRRVGNQPLLSNALKVVVSHSPFEPPAPGALCANQEGYDEADLPPNDCIDDQSNRARLRICEALFRDNPDYYEGNDQTFALPVNGRFFGVVDGRDPRNQQAYSGAQFFVDTNLAGIDALLVNWQYDCSVADFNDPALGPERCEPRYPEDSPRSDIGFHYMSGAPVAGQQRRIMRISLRNQLFSAISAQAGIYVDLDSDNVNF